MSDNDWSDQFRAVFADGVKRYRAGQREVASFFTDEESAFLTSIGCTAEELFDFVEDYSNGGDPTFETVRGMAVRREYPVRAEWCHPSISERWTSFRPSRPVEGIRTPRIIEKARPNCVANYPKR